MSNEKAISITKRVKSYADACAIKGITPLTQEQFAFLPTDQQAALFSLHKIITVIEVVNESWQPDWNDYDEYKYYPWWDMETYEDDVPGSGFRFDDYGSGYAATCVGSRLVCRSSDLSEYVAKLMLDDYRAFMKK